MTTQSNEKEVKPAHELSLAVMNDDRVKKGIDVAAGVISVSDEAYEAAFEHAGITAKEYKKHQEAVSRAAMGLIEAASEKTSDQFSKHKELHTASGEVKMGHDDWSVTFTREADVAIPNSGGKTKKVFMHTDVRRKSAALPTSVKQLKERIAAQGFKKYGN